MTTQRDAPVVIADAKDNRALEASVPGVLGQVDGAEEVRVGRAQNFLEEEHVSQLFEWFEQFKDVENHVKVATMDDLEENEFNLNIPLYVEKVIEDDLPTVEVAMADLKEPWNKAQAAEARFKQLLQKFTA